MNTHDQLTIGFRAWLWMMDTLEKNAFGIDPQDPPQGLADYWMMNGLALHEEVSEMMAEFGWKPWDATRGKWSNREQAISEWADTMHFTAHLLLSIGATPDELAHALMKKVEKNYARQAQPDGDNVQARRCPGCGRSVDDTSESDGEQIWCSVCGTELEFYG